MGGTGIGRFDYRTVLFGTEQQQGYLGRCQCIPSSHSCLLEEQTDNSHPTPCARLTLPEQNRRRNTPPQPTCPPWVVLPTATFPYPRPQFCLPVVRILPLQQPTPTLLIPDTYHVGCSLEVRTGQTQAGHATPTCSALVGILGLRTLIGDRGRLPLPYCMPTPDLPLPTHPTGRVGFWCSIVVLCPIILWLYLPIILPRNTWALLPNIFELPRQWMGLSGPC